jgi:hypothetical protein
MNGSISREVRIGADDSWINLLGYEGDFGIPPLGFLLEFTLMMAMAATAPRCVPMFMGWIWPETASLRTPIVPLRVARGSSA